jgi:hypothetical protein
VVGLVVLSEVIKRRGQRFTYEYDFGDGWMHEVRVEKIEAVVDTPPAPRCLDGARACPPEDCGGPWGYQALLAARSDPNDRNLERWGEPDWVRGLDTERFALDEVNRRL